MSEKSCGERKDAVLRYNLPPDNIIAQDENTEIRKKNKNLFLGLADEDIDWPAELQGSGRSDYDKKEFKIHYPTGDIFLSVAVTIHELGHLRQGEIDPRFASEVLGAPKISPMDELASNQETEEDAWRRGLARAKQYCPEFMQEIEAKFKQHKEAGRLVKFENFEIFFNHVVAIGLKVSELTGKAEQEMNGVEDERREGQILGRYLKIENFIKKVTENIALEKYPKFVNH